MGEKEKATKILKILNKIYPTTPIPLNHTNKFTLLMSVLLSAQCTDLNVNNVTKDIYPKFNKPEHFGQRGEAGPCHRSKQRDSGRYGNFRTKPIVVFIFIRYQCVQSIVATF